jgi:3-hydroxybutyryl-CoA dehydrogenase
VDDTAAGVLGRIVCQTVNEGCFAVGERVGSAADVDMATTLGLNHPYGPIAWGDRIGWNEVVARLDGLYAERHDPRFRAAPLLRRAAASNVSVRGFPRRSYAWV